MAGVVHVKEKTSWKPVEFSRFVDSKGDFDGLISFEELTDYEIVKGEVKVGKKKSKVKGEAKAKEDAKRKLKEKDVEGKPRKKSTEKKVKKSGKVIKTGAQANQQIDDLNETVEEKSDLEKEQDQLKKKKKKEKMKRKIQELKNKRKLRKEKQENEPKQKKVKLEQPESSEDEAEDDDATKGMERWKGLHVPEEVLRALRDAGFRAPTSIQAQVLPSAIRDQMDIVGAAETGSGKTLAFGIPLLHFILEEKRKENDPQSMDEMESDSGNETGNADVEDIDASADQEKEEESNEMDETNSDMEEESEDDEDNGEAEEKEDEQSEDESDDGENSDEENVGELQEDGTGCVAVVKDADFSWMEGLTPAPMMPGAPMLPRATRTHPRALILEPTRELAIQVKNHLVAAAKYTDIKVAVIVGGLSMEKQRRVLKKCPDIIVATPGRLWELIQEGETCLHEVEKTRLLVVDEADRMIEKGHFDELARLLEKMKRDSTKEIRHTFVFSATLTLIHTGPQRVMKKRKKKMDEKTKLGYLMRKMGLKPKPKIVDLTRKMGTVETLTEARIHCPKEEKDIYLYYFLRQYPGRTLVFANSKDCIRRLVSVFTILQCRPLPLHADMHQRQRLKNLDKFTANPNGLLLASDVAARGLDIPNVEHVIHYQVPQTVENYVHRSGRTARAMKEGLSVVLIGPDDVKSYKKIIHTLNKNEDLPMFPVEQTILSELKRRVNMVRQIETQEYRFNKKKRQNDWFIKSAEEAGVEIDDAGLLDDLGDDDEQQRHRQHLRQMKHELSLLLGQPLAPQSTYTKYPTRTGKLVTPQNTERSVDALAQLKKNKKVEKQATSEVEQTTNSSEQTTVSRSQKRRQLRREKWKKRKEEPQKTE
ncbi:ATP-dependent RNA helicase DDX24-like [Mya arenaria]|uniref:ATP-dependent RNA helicase DDX24-like n=1 Tax=Mya arenaria TaxID=6604 RepID=UPI0022E18C7C|nr:ATP-dependent RNA helicase DDX24-like [Mya arenaria]